MTEGIKPYIETVQSAEQGMSLWQLLESGGIVMVVLGVLSIAMVAIVVYFFLRFSPEKLVPLEFSQDVIRKFPYICQWKTFTLIASSFPLTLQGMQEDSIEVFLGMNLYCGMN